MLSWIEILILVVGGWLVLRLINQRDGKASGGGFSKLLGIAAIAAGIGFFWMRAEQPAAVESVVVEGSAADELHPADDVLYAETHTQPARWVFVMLGSALVMLGGLLFSRGATRPVALKAVTILGIGAIVYAIVTFVGQPPRPISVASHRDVVEELAPEGRLHAERPASRARRPLWRPERPATEDRKADTLPPRAGEIPVGAELVKQPTPPAPAAPSEPPVPTPAEVPVSAEAPAPAAVEPAPAPAADANQERKESNTSAETATASTAKPSTQSALASAGPRPDWVDARAGLTAGGAYRIPVHSGRFTSVPECQRALEHEIKQASDHYIDEYLDPGVATEIDLPLTYLNQRVKKNEYAEAVQSETVGEMYEIHALLEFDSQTRADFHRLRRNAEVVRRLWYTGGGAALVLALLTTFYGYLKLDLRTGGAHKGRLQLAATLVALIAATGVLLMRWAVPF